MSDNETKTNTPEFERDLYKAALEEIWTTYINAGQYVISAGTLAYIAKDALEDYAQNNPVAKGTK